ncbi:TBCC domain-containing protein 1 isoform X2 [Denticeps clupeoides]|uniref:TBCC domain-containing protein 1 isoform X2 n=1 Tax=Denticeps clupeoides TaxID=299321 RepID=UPI0010A2BF01|nr:TBCC domain-containing protein 1 isoform X2 [Denticeps clupeoides]
MEQSGVSVWPRLEPFLLGTLQVTPSTKLSAHYLRKMAAYVRTRDGCYPRLGWPMWRHIACGKLLLPEELAWLYFETFELLVARSPEERLERAEALSQCSSPKELDRQRSKFNHISLRTSLIGEEWPSQRSRWLSDRETKTSSQNKNWDDQAHLTFVQTHLSELLVLLLEPEQLTSLGQKLCETQLSQDSLQGLSLLLEGATGHGRPVQPLHRLLSHSPLQAQAGFSKLSRGYVLHRLKAWLRQTLRVNPFGVLACLRSGKKMYWTQQVEGAVKRAKIVQNVDMVPPGNKIVLWSQVYRQTLAKDSETLSGANVKLQSCNEAFIYLLSPLKSVTVDKCRNCTVVLGAVESLVHVQSCENVRLVCVAGRLTVGASTRCTFHILTPMRPLLLPSNSSLTLGPFHAHYPLLEDHMASVGLAVVPNLWDQPLLLGTEGSTPDAGCYRILPPAELWPLAVPFQMEGDTCEVPGGLPPSYQKVVETRKCRVQEWYRSVNEAHLSRAQKQQIQVLVEQKFYEWLSETGHRLELDTLTPTSPSDVSSISDRSWDATLTKAQPNSQSRGATAAF